MGHHTSDGVYHEHDENCPACEASMDQPDRGDRPDGYRELSAEDAIEIIRDAMTCSGNGWLDKHTIVCNALSRVPVPRKYRDVRRMMRGGQAT